MTEKMQTLILLAEDEELIGLALSEALADEGFHIIHASDGARAVSELNDDAGRFSAVITDIRLGDGPSGWDVARHARELIEGIPVIYISGDAEHEWLARGVANSVLRPKPFAADQIITTLATLLNEASQRHED